MLPREPDTAENLAAILREVHAGVPYECLCHARCLKAVSIVSTEAIRRSQKCGHPGDLDKSINGYEVELSSR